MARAKMPGRGSDQFPLRLPDGMREQIKEEASRNGDRSMNQEIVERLRQSLALPPMDIPEVLLERMQEADEKTRAMWGRVLVDDLNTYFPPPAPPKKTITITTRNMVEALERSISKTPEVQTFLDRLKQQMASGEIDGDAPAQFGVPPDFEAGEAKK